MVRFDHPQSGQVIQSPLRVQGGARGMWYFEGSFPIKLLSDKEGVITDHYVMADSEWMTEDFVSFSTQIPFSHPEGASGRLVLERSNPSGRPERAQEVGIPIQFPRGESSEILVYFNREQVAECENTVAVSRTIARTQARAALQNLFAGPTWQEERQGYITPLPDGVTIERLVIQDGTAEVGLNEKLDQGVPGSCRRLIDTHRNWFKRVVVGYFQDEDAWLERISPPTS